MNDYEMIEKAGNGIAMGNAVDKLKEVADYVTRPIEEEGVSFALRHFGYLSADQQIIKQGQMCTHQDENAQSDLLFYCPAFISDIVKTEKDI